jgi:hypothetical protein
MKDLRLESLDDLSERVMVPGSLELGDKGRIIRASLNVIAHSSQRESGRVRK